MSKYLIYLCSFLCACASGGSIATFESFDDISVGTTQEDVTSLLGTPVRTTKCDDGTVEFVYVERIKVGAKNLNERYYYIKIRDGKVISKRVTQDSPPGYRFNSYQMQTTKNDGQSELE